MNGNGFVSAEVRIVLFHLVHGPGYRGNCLMPQSAKKGVPLLTAKATLVPDRDTASSMVTESMREEAIGDDGNRLH